MITLKSLLTESNLEWKRELYARFPSIFADEIFDERPTGTKEDREEIKDWKLESDHPIKISILKLLNIKENLETISRCPKEVVDHINQTWNLKVPYGKVYDRNPDRYFKYSKMEASTANPSTMKNGEIIWGVGRFIAALLRKDLTLNVWKVI